MKEGGGTNGLGNSADSTNLKQFEKAEYTKWEGEAYEKESGLCANGGIYVLFYSSKFSCDRFCKRVHC